MHAPSFLKTGKQRLALAAGSAAVLAAGSFATLASAQMPGSHDQLQSRIQLCVRDFRLGVGGPLSACVHHAIGLFLGGGSSSSMSSQPSSSSSSSTSSSSMSSSSVSSSSSTTPSSVSSSSAAMANVSITANGAFSPQNLTVKTGTTVKWTNNSSMLQTVTTPSTFSPLNSPALMPGGTFSFTFTQVGTFQYRSLTNPSMTGTVTVQQ